MAQTDTALARQAIIERYMLGGFSLTQMAAIKTKDPKTGRSKKLGTIKTISNDMDIIKSRWLDNDTSWFHRASIARREAVNRLKEQLVRLNLLISGIIDGKYDIDIDKVPARQAYTESQITNVITKIYEIDSDFDPENYIDDRVRESILGKIDEAEQAKGR